MTTAHDMCVAHARLTEIAYLAPVGRLLRIVQEDKIYVRPKAKGACVLDFIGKHGDKDNFHPLVSAYMLAFSTQVEYELETGVASVEMWLDLGRAVGAVYFIKETMGERTAQDAKFLLLDFIGREFPFCEDTLTLTLNLRDMSEQETKAFNAFKNSQKTP